MSEQSITLILVALVSAAGGLLTYISSRRTQNQQKDRDVVSEWRELYGGVVSENTRLNDRVKMLELEIGQLQQKLADLERRMIDQAAQHDRERSEWLIEQLRLRRRLDRYERSDDTPPVT